MFGKRWQLFRLSGIPVSLDASWLIILALLTFSMASTFPRLMERVFGEEAAAPSPTEYWLMGLAAALAFFVCILLHELGHAVVARRRGMHIHGITLFLFGGVAELGGEPPSPGTEFLMAIAGPLVSLVLAVGFAVLAGLGYSRSWPPAVVFVLGYLATVNLLVLIFNLIPAFPLDGGRVLRSILWGATGNLRRATYWAALAGRVFAWGLIAWGLVQFVMGNWLGGVWSALIGLFLSGAARGGYRQVLVREALEGEPVRRFVNRHPIVVPPELDLQRWVKDFVYHYHRKFFPVVSDGRLEGVITTQALTEIPRAEWDLHTVGEVMRRDIRALTISPDADALEALARMRRTGASRLLVTEGGRLVGILSLKDLLRFLDLKLELEGAEAEDSVPGSATSPGRSSRRGLVHGPAAGRAESSGLSGRAGDSEGSASDGR